MDDSINPHTSRMFLTQALGFASIAALAVQAWEFFVYFTDEVEYLWKGRFNAIKGLYFCSRYGMLLAQIVNQALSYGLGEGVPQLHHNMCSGMFVYKTVVGQLGLNLVEIILLLRVYALYNRSYRMKFLLGGSFITASLLETTGTVIVIQSLAPAVDCQLPEASSKGLLIFGIGAAFCQCVIFVTTLNKFVTGRSYGWARTPLTSLMLREGVVVFFLILALLIVMSAYELIRNLTPGVGQAAFSWYITFISIGASRLILSMRKVAVDQFRNMRHHETEAGNLYLTTHELDDSICLDSFHG